MSVYTTVTPVQLSQWLTRYGVGQLIDCQGINDGVTNTNYFVSTTQGRYVLTLFETLTLKEVPFYLKLMSHLVRHAVAVPAPIADRIDSFASLLCDKPACLVTRLAGRTERAPSVTQCAAVGETIAQLHLAGNTYPARMSNPRGPAWWHKTAQEVYPHMNAEDAHLLHTELAVQESHRFEHLPSGIIHGDLFRDNVLFDGERLSGVIDFYYACNDLLLYDLAITLNDWAVLSNGDLDAARTHALLAAYQHIRPLNTAEIEAWPIMLRAAALRFWVSRLYDFYHPQPGSLTQAHDPQHFQRVIEQHRNRHDFWL